MEGLILTAAEWMSRSEEELLAQVRQCYPQAQAAQDRSWQALIREIKGSGGLASLPEDCAVALEYALPTDGMAIDLLVAGTGPGGRKTACIVEAKQWSDDFIEKSRFSAYREPETELHPQVQVSHHCLSFGSYLDIGPGYALHPFVYLPNATAAADRLLMDTNPRPACASIPLVHTMGDLLGRIGDLLAGGDPSLVQELRGSCFSPSRGVIDAMEAVVTKNESFLLTPDQRGAVEQVLAAMAAGKKIIRITGAAGAGKTAILLNLYVQALNDARTTGIIPIFVTGAQNTAFYRSEYSQSASSFTYSLSLRRMVNRGNGRRCVIFMDEAQHNQPGILTEMADLGATLVLCYDVAQVITPENPIAELRQLEARRDFLTVELRGSIRFNGSQAAEKNIRTLLRGGTAFADDPLYEFQVFHDFSSFQEKIFDTIARHPDRTLAVAGLLSSDAGHYTREGNSASRLFTHWGSKSECEWLPYVRGRNYLARYNGDLWVGTWWMPGLDVDYMAAIVGGDAAITDNGLLAVPEKAKHYRMMVGVARQLGFPEELTAYAPARYGERSVNFVATAQNICGYISRPGNEAARESFLHRFSQYLRNNYYIMLSRGRRGCFVYFTDDRHTRT